MQQEQAVSLAEAWVRAHGPDIHRVQPLYDYLRSELMSVFPDDGVFGVGRIGETPRVIGVTDRSLMLATAEEVAADEGSYARVRIERSPLAPGNALVSLQSWVGWGTTSIRHREWRFALAPAGPEIELRTREVVRGGFSGAAGPQPDELVARAIARRLDWNVPERDAGRAEY